MVSILMPVKNAGDFLKACIESIQAQEGIEWELIAVNDHSTDGSNECLLQFASEDDRINVFQNNGSGIVAGLQTAYAQAKGNCIHRMDADDLMPKRKLELMASELEMGCVVTGKVKYFSDEWLVGLGFQNYESWINTMAENGGHWKEIYKECPIPSPAWMMYREDFERIGGFQSDLIPEDYDLCFRMYENEIEIKALNEVVHLWRDSQNRTSRKLPEYFPMAYYPLKMTHFMRIDRDESKDLVLWGAGKKGKRIAKWLLEKEYTFHWISDNKNKHNVSIHGVVLESTDIELRGKQTILAMASPEDKKNVQAKLDKDQLEPAQDYYWFC